MYDYDTIQEMKKEEARQAATQTKVNRLLAITIAAMAVLTVCLIILWFSQPDPPAPTADPAPAIAEQGGNITINSTAVQPTSQPAQVVIIHTGPPRNPYMAGRHQLVHISHTNPTTLHDIGIAYIGHDGQPITAVMCSIPQGLGCAYIAPPVPATSPFYIFWNEGNGRIYQTADPDANPITANSVFFTTEDPLN